MLLKLWSSWFLMKVNLFLSQIAKSDKCINLFCLDFLTLEFSFVVSFSIADAKRFHCYLYLGNILLTINFIAFDFIILSDLNSNLIISLKFYLLEIF